jgi:hypothetical protein
VAPDRVFFGEKDYQQLVLVRQMVADLNVDTRVIGVPTVRETDGLAMSSRNRYLNAAQRELAATLSAALLAGTHAAPGGAAGRATTRPARCSSEVPAIDVDYLELRDSGARARCRPADPDACWSPPGWARPDCSTMSQLKSELPSRDGLMPRAGRAGRSPRITLEELMLRTMLKSKIHRATVTQADLHYVGSVTIDADLMDAADLLEGEQVTIVDIDNGARLVTYAITGRAWQRRDRNQRGRSASRAPRRLW